MNREVLDDIISRSISQQFYGLDAKFPLRFEFKVVKEFDTRFLKIAQKLHLWAFVVAEHTCIVGFSESRFIKIKPQEIFIKLNIYGIVNEILIHDGVRVFILHNKESAQDYAQMLDTILYNDVPWDRHEVQNIIDQELSVE